MRTRLDRRDRNLEILCLSLEFSLLPSFTRLGILSALIDIRLIRPRSLGATVNFEFTHRLFASVPFKTGPSVREELLNVIEGFEFSSPTLTFALLQLVFSPGMLGCQPVRIPILDC